MDAVEEIKSVHPNGSHVVLLGAGASLASTLRTPEKNGKVLPLMNNLVDVVELEDVVGSLPSNVQKLKNNFEALFSYISEKQGFEEQRNIIEQRIYDYFSSLQLPDKPTIYDYLILSLRWHKDLIATFNWDPFLYQAYKRNEAIVKSPRVLFLHGNVSIGYDKSSGFAGPAGTFAHDTGEMYHPTKLLYPVTQKDYNSDEFINNQWRWLQEELTRAERVTVFGYSAPKTDVEAIKLLKSAWGNVNDRNMEEFEFIDVQDEELLLESWKEFVHTHHYTCHKSFFSSSLRNHPRRTVESYHHWAMARTPNQMFQNGNPIPENFSNLHELWEWFVPLIEAEETYYQNR